MGWLAALVAAWGLPLVVLGTAIEGDTVAMVGGALAHRGVLPGGLVPVALAAALGAFVSDQAWFTLGRRAGGTARAGRLRASAPGRRLAAMLARHPVLPLVLFRFVWGTRAAGPVIFGAEGVRRGRFVVIDLAASLLWGATFAGLGYGLGLGVERALGRLDLGRHLGLVALGIASVPLLVWLASRRRGRRLPR